MISLTSFIRRASQWIDDVAAVAAHVHAFFRRARRVELIEQADGAFLVSEWRDGADDLEGPPLRIEDGRFVGPPSVRLQALLARSRAEVVLEPSRFIFRSLELPRGASQFLEGVVRSQIDRLTPWSASEAAFGWSAPVEAGGERIAVTVAATARSLVAPVAQALAASGAGHIRMSARAGAEAATLIPIYAQRSGAEDHIRLLRGRLVAGVGFFALAFALSFGGWAYLCGREDARLAELQSRIAERRAALTNGNGSTPPAVALDARKRAVASTVMTLDALSKMLPDDTHLTQLRIDDGKVQIVGLTRDAPELIRLIEQSRQFTQATFFAPTVRGLNGGGETFHIEAHIEPSFSVTN